MKENIVSAKVIELDEQGFSVKTGIKGGAVADIRPPDDGAGGITQEPLPPTSSGG
jgi:hypothetical protein